MRIAWYRGVYPRAYGETDDHPFISDSRTGLSPRLRGNRGIVTQRMTAIGSIPALTGKPTGASSPRRWSAVYPRAYGETAFGRREMETDQGLSPRLRGNPPRELWPQTTDGSIPALTGKPHGGGSGERRHRVYPRAYGETRPPESVTQTSRGLSPRLRGNLL